MSPVTYDKFREDASRMFEGAVESTYKDLLEKAVAEAVMAEREACADICDQHASIEGIAQRCAAEIRERGNK